LAGVRSLQQLAEKGIRYYYLHFIMFQVWLRDTPRTGVSAGVGVEGENINEGGDSRGGYMQKQKAKELAAVLWGRVLEEGT
jgi:hypothetical protein